MKSKSLKKIVSAGLAVMMMAGLGMGASAAEDVTIDTSRSGSITVHKYEGNPLDSVGQYDSQADLAAAVEASDSLVPEAGVVFRYQKVGDVLQYTKNAGTSSNVTKIGYSVNGEVSSLLGLEAGDADYTAADGTVYYTASTLDEKLDTFLADGEAIKTSVEQLLSKSTSFPATGADGSAKVSNLPLGLYLVSEYNYPAETTGITEPFFVSVPMTDVDADGNASWIYDVNVYPKNQLETPSVDKVIVGNDGNETKELDVQTDDSTVFRIRADVPNYVGKLKTYRISDILSGGLTYDQGSYVVYGIDRENQTRKKLNDGNEFQFTADGQTLTWTFNNANISEPDSKVHLYDGIEIEYSATLNENALVGAANENALSLTYSTTANLDTQEDPTETIVPDETPGIYTYALDLYKYGDSDQDNPLKDVTFEIQDTDGKVLKVSEQSAGHYVIDKDGTAVMTTGSDGHIYLKGLETGTYYLKETNTNQGFSLLKNKIEITVTSNENTYTESETGTYALVNPNRVYGKGATRKYADGEQFVLPAGLDKATYIHFDTASVTENGNAAITYTQNSLEWDSNYAMGERDSADSGVIRIYVNNTKMFQLPVTGGNGTVLFVTAGAVLVAAGICCLLMVRRKRNRS